MTQEETKRPWVQIGNEYHQMNPSSEFCKQLPLAIYSMKFNDRSHEVYLEKIDDTFSFNHKIYDLDNAFIDHIVKTYNNTTNNLGILLNGTKGTGKTVCGKILSIRFNLPVILCEIPYEEIVPFIAQFNCPAIFFFDEFEKKFSKESHLLLSAMDGAYNTDVRKIFIMTTNNLSIDSNFLGRPSRIRYVKTFGNLPEKVVREFCADNLLHQERTEDVVSFIDSLKVSTIDILKTLVEEINIHDCEIECFEDFFNVSKEQHIYNCIVAATSTTSYTEQDFIKDCAEYERSLNPKERRKSSQGLLKFVNVESDKPIDKLKLGDSFYTGTILSISEDKSLIVLDTRYYGDDYYYDRDCVKAYVRILNPDKKPSLFKYHKS